MSYLIIYISENPGETNQNLINRIKSYSNWVILNEYNFIVSFAIDEVSEFNLHIHIRDDLKNFISSKDKILVTELTGIGAWKGFTSETSSWLKEYL